MNYNNTGQDLYTSFTIFITLPYSIMAGVPMTIHLYTLYFYLLSIWPGPSIPPVHHPTNTLHTSTSPEWTSIFNGKDLKGWSVKIAGYPLGENFGNTFRVKDSILSIRYDAYLPEFKNRFGAIYFDRELTAYRLRLEYRFLGETAPGAPDWGYRDSGVQFHSQPPSTVSQDQQFPVCLEYNLHGGDGSGERPTGEICANGMFVEIEGKRNGSYCTPPTLKKTFHGDQWVTLEIDVTDSLITHYANGEEILHYQNPVYDTVNEVSRKFLNTDELVVRSGYLSLQSNSHPVDFRRIELMEYPVNKNDVQE